MHSPLVGPSTWYPVAEVFERRGITAVVPDLDGDERIGRPLWLQHSDEAARAAAALGRGSEAVLVGHSGAGALLPAIRTAMRRSVAGYVFVDAGLPDGTHPRKGAGPFAEHVDRVYTSGRRIPEWTDADLKDVIPDEARRSALLSGLRPQPLRFWNETIPVFEGWPDAPCAYLRLGPNRSYEPAVLSARERGWPVHELAAEHFHMLVNPEGVTDAVLALVAEMVP